MIPNVQKGGNMYGLVTYLVGPGRANEHEDPHVVSGDPFLQAWYGTEMLDRGSVGGIVDYLEEPRKTYGTEIRVRVTDQDPETGEKRLAGYRPQHVWHCSLSLKAGEDGPLSDGDWDDLARDFMDRMGFTEESGKAPCRWVAIHHGRSKNGHDHIHIAASMVREDGTRWEGRYRDYAKAQEVCRELESAHGLTRVTGPEQGIGDRGEKPAERRQAADAGLRTTAPKELGERIRGASVAAVSEAEWIRRVRADGVVLKPFYAKGTTDVVRGYRAALKPESYNERLVFYKGSSLGRDLSLPRLREGWPDATVETAGQAAGEWQAAFRGQAPVGVEGRESIRFEGLAPGVQDVAAQNFAAFNDRLTQVPVGDRAAWSDAARDAAGVLSSWARFDPDNAGEFRDAAAALSRSAQLRRAPQNPGRRVKESPMGTALLLSAAAPGKDKAKVAGVVFLRQVIKTAEALRDHHRATANVREAELIQRQVVERLERIQLTGYAPDPDAGKGKTNAATAGRTGEGHESGAGRDAQRVASALSGSSVTGTTPKDADGQGSDPLPRPLRRADKRSTTRAGPGNKKGENDGRG